MSTALLAGATGLVGGFCLQSLIEDEGYDEIRVLTRRDIGDDANNPRVRQIVVDFSTLAERAEEVRGDHIFCALGTTIRKAKSRRYFREVDLEYPLTIGRLALANGAAHFSLVSSLGADPSSRLFYSRVKGEAEETIAALGYESVTILRPSLLLGPRREFRLGERVGALLGGLAPQKYRPTEALAVARVMVATARDPKPGVRVIEAAEITALGKEIP